ncbi:MAG: O-acetylhomoserine aminocarboxypropyltransferase/cysteine synthase [Sulfurimonas sp.]|jgi:O-acetylhomoserine (thiol)-lyase|nr:O-acetylhomoserine aminocarboxypropyltransferase/cysteine synthase [Sulfurimonas sp.]MBU1217309.1 aminotransferase class I/II-fold pyridoxal phosphate-dependent enzyme [bacterium]MBU1433842.1 aminotransferase class I/II-fold pyridoxal phosphate-dependent enzyme [bacterium]MBU1503541.1 aminotransferase class I/II-fold pyridoxal phosphate-dependent enzyme [bacterium]MBU3939710.1 aminotransferase class I/II-fold pyridoxal phosphate-dependent enzyme [bacterium]
MNHFEEYCTKFVQEVGSKEGAISPSIVSSASFAYGTPEIGEGIFDGSVKKPLYSRMGNPTTSKLEGILASMDEGIGAVATSSGMGATALATMSLLSAGDEIVSIGGLFGGTYSYFEETLSRFGIKTHFFDVDEIEAIINAINDNTKIIFLESVGNPNMRLPDIKRIASIANTAGVALIVDNTTTPMSISPLKLGADIVVYSTTKIISGNASALGGCAVFRAINEGEDKFKTPRYSFLAKFIKGAGAMALIPNAKKRAMRDFGMSANAHASYQTMLGLETLPLRMERIVKSVSTIAKELYANGLVVNHPSLPLHPHHEIYLSDFKGGCGSLLTIDMGTKEKAFEFLNKTKLATITANIGDSRTLALHMASTIYRDFDEKTREFLGITDGLIRVSIGLENPQDIIEDFLNAAK